jgi:hypothetical protein
MLAGLPRDGWNGNIEEQVGSPCQAATAGKLTGAASVIVPSVSTDIPEMNFDFARQSSHLGSPQQ